MNSPHSTNLEYRITKVVNVYIPPIIIVLGTIGNTLSFVVYSRRKQRQKPLSIYMRSLAVADTCMLILLCADWLNYKYLHQRTEFRCIATDYLQHLMFNICEYILVAITFSRLMAIVHPLRAAKKTTQTKFIVIVIVVLSVVVNLYYIWTTEFLVRKKGHKIIYACMTGQHFNGIITFIMWFDTTKSFIIPMSLIFVGNVCIVCSLRDRKRSKIIEMQRELAMEARRRKENKITMMLVMVTFVFLILVLPYFVYYMYRYFVYHEKKDAKSAATDCLVTAICLKLWYSNNAVNFYVYALFGTQFRKELKELFTRKSLVGPLTTAVVSLRGTGRGREPRVAH